MTYRVVARHISYWRGNPHKWSTVYQYVGTPSTAIDTAACQTMLGLDDAMCYGPGAAGGGTYECEIYDQASGGVAVASYTAFDPTDVGAWPGYSGAAWADTHTYYEANLEASLSVEWAAGLSKSGKPVKLRKWYHALPFALVTPPAHDISTTDLTSLAAGALALTHGLGSYGLLLGSSTGRLAGSAQVNPYYESHQMPRGRRRKALVTAGGHYTGPAIEIPSLD
uniref:Uncharacterized protein n=1 Tax=uncultured prokaryote TaxID=198431 RepID=A0A0H5Q2H0_9ZZZZ|nr:hypothetical protein [uncultured prokaryote]